MDNNFIENCKLLKKQFTELTGIDTTSEQSSSCVKLNKTKKSVSATINKAEKILLMERLDSLDNIDIEDIKQNYLLNYPTDLDQINYKNHDNFRLCERDLIKWNDDVFSSCLPCPKNNNEYIQTQIKLNAQKLGINDQKCEILSRTELLGIKTQLNKNNKNKKEIPTIQLKGEEIINENNEEKLENKTVSENIVMEPLPELNIIPHQQKDIEKTLEIKKLICDDNKIDNNFDSSRTKDIAKKSINKWKSYKQKRQDLNNTPCFIKINNFLENLKQIQNSIATKPSLNENVKATPEKVKASNTNKKPVTSYEHRFKAQQTIIEQQKEKLEEQKRLIENLKLNKIEKEAKESLNFVHNELKKAAVYTKYNNKYKLSVEEQEPKENKEINLSLNLIKAPSIIQRMEERAKEREEKRLMIKERKKLIEEQKKQHAEEAIQRKHKEELMERQERMALIRSQREQIRQMELKKQMEKKYFMEMNDTAYKHYKKKLKCSGLKHFKMLIFNSKIKMEIGKRFYENNIILKCFLVWKQEAKQSINNKIMKANNLYNKHLLKNYMKSWKKYNFAVLQSKQVAIDRYEMSLQIKFFKAWHLLTCENHLKYKAKSKIAIMHYTRTLLFQCFHSWRSLPAIMHIERVQNERKRKWRLRVAEILSDYDPLKFYKE